MAMFKPLKTERLLIRPVCPRDVNALIARRNDPEVAQYQDWPVPCERVSAEKIAAEDANGQAPNSWRMLTIADSEDTQVYGDVNMRIGSDGIAVVGYALAREFWGNGYATEALNAVVQWMFEECDVVRIDATIHPDHFRSGRMLENCGFEFVGVDRNTWWDRYGRVDDLRYALTPELLCDWNTRPRYAPQTVELIEPHPTGLREVLNLKVHHSQKRFVSPLVVSLAQVAVPPLEQGFENDANGPRVMPWPRIIHADGEPVGFVMMEVPTEHNPEPYLWRLLIDRYHQRRGIGGRVLQMVIGQALAWGSESLMVSWVPGIGSPEPMYLTAGFIPTGEIDDDEIVARLTLRQG